MGLFKRFDGVYAATKARVIYEYYQKPVRFFTICSIFVALLGVAAFGLPLGNAATDSQSPARLNLIGFEIKAKKHFRTDELPEFELVERIQEEQERGILQKIGDFFSGEKKEEDLDIGVTVVNLEGEERVLARGQDFTIEADQPDKFEVAKFPDFAPGVYKAKINFKKNGQNYSLEQGFSWGLIDEVKKPEDAPEYPREMTGEGESISLSHPAILIVPSDKMPDGARVIVEGVDDEIITENPTITKSEEDFQVTINPQSRGMKPGKYKLKVFPGQENGEGVIYEKEFFWGVLAFNPDFSVYPSRTPSYLSFAVLDDLGRMVCDAGLVAQITDPIGKVTYLGTGDGTIRVNEECYIYGETQKPDFEADFQPTLPGQYNVEITARFKEGQRTLKDFFFVDPEAPFYLKRTGPTRTFPLAQYDYILELTTRREGHYEIIEKVPSAFTDITIENCSLLNCQTTIEDAGDTKILKWSFDAAKDSSNQLVYSFKPSFVSPYLYLFGPAVIRLEKELGGGSSISRDWEEPRSWLVANDASVSPNAALDASASAAPQNHEGEGRKLVYTNDQTAYLFYTDGTGSVSYMKTTNGGLNWAAAVIITAQTDTENFGIWYDGWTPGDTTGGLIHIAFLETSGDDIYYEYVDTKNADAQKGEVLAVSRSTDPHTSTTDSISITRATNGVLYIAASSSIASSVAIVRKSTDVGTNWSDTADEGLDDATQDPVMLLPLVNDDILLLRWDISAEDIQSKEYEDVGNSWDGSWTNVDTNAVDDGTNAWTETWSATINPDNYDIYLAYLDNAGTASATPDIRTAIYNGASWTAKTDVLTDTNTVLGVTIALDTLTDNVYVAYLRGTTTVNAAYYKMSTNGMTNWSVELGKPLSIAATDMGGLQSNFASPYEIGIWAFDDTLDDIWYANLDDIGAPSGAITFIHGTTTGANFQGFEAQDSHDADATAGTFSYSTTTFRSGAAALRTNPTTSTGNVTIPVQYNTTGVVASTDVDNCQMVVGLYISSSTTPNQAMSIIRLLGAATVETQISLNTNQTLSITNDSAVNGSYALVDDTWYVIAITAAADVTTTTNQVRIYSSDMQTMYEELVQNATVLDFDQVSLGPSTASSTVDLFFDDFVITCHNESWNFPLLHNDYRIEHMALNATGTDTAWTNDYTNLDEIPTSTADYIETLSAGAAETSNMESASSAGISGTVLAVRASQWAWESSATTTSVNAVRWRQSSNTTDTGAVDLGGTGGQEFVNILVDVPGAGTARLTTSDLDALEVGIVNVTGEATVNRNSSTVVQALFIPAATITVSGTCQAYDQSSNCGDLGTIKVAIDGTLQSQEDTGGGTSGTFSIASVPKPQKGQTVTVFVDGAAGNSDKAVALTKYDGSGDITGIALFKEHLTVGSVDDQVISAHEMSTYDNSASGDADIFFDIDSGDIIVDDTSFSTQEELYIGSGDTLRPGADTTTAHIEIAGTFTHSSNYSSLITLIGTGGTLFTRSGTFTQGISEVRVTSASGTPTFLSGATAFHKLTINSSATVINMGASTLTINNVSGAQLYIQSGVFNASGADVTGPGGSNGTLQVDNGTTLCFGGTTSSSNATCNSGASDTTTRSMPTFQTYTFGATSTISYLSDADTTISQTPTYGNLKLNPVFVTTSRTYTLGGAMTINGNFDINPDESGASTPSLTVNAGGNITVASGKTTTITRTNSATSTLDLRPSATDYNLSTGLLNVATGGTLDASSTTSSTLITLTGTSGTLWTQTGTFTITSATSTVVFNPDATVTLTSNNSITFYNLTLNPNISDNRTYSFGTSALSINGDFTINPTATVSSKTLTVNMNATITVASGKTTTLQGSGGNNPIGKLDTNTSNSLSTGFLNIATNGELAAGSANITLTGTSGTLFTRIGTFTAGTSTVTMNPDAAVTLTSGTITFYNLTLSPAITTDRTYTFGAGAITINNNFNINPDYAGFASALLTVNMGAAITVSGTTTITRTGSNATSLLDTRPSSTDYDLTTGLLNVATGGTLDAGSAASTITLTGTSGTPFTVAGTFTEGSSTVIFNGDASLTLNGNTAEASTFFNLTLNPSISTAGRAYTFGTTALTINGDFLIQPSGTQLLTVNPGAHITVASTKTTTISRTSTATSTLDLRPSSTDYNLTTGNLTIDTGGTLDAASAASAINIAGNYTNNGTFTAGNSTVTLNGSSTQTLSGTMTSGSAFSTLAITNSSGSVSGCETSFTPGVDFAASATFSTYSISTAALSGPVHVEYNDGSTYTVTKISWVGTAARNIYFRNSNLTAGSWLLVYNPGSASVSYVNVARSDASGGTQIPANDGTNTNCNNNTNWNFGNPTFSQEDYRFGSPNGLDIDYTGAPAENSAYSTSGTSDDFRLRLLIHVSDAELAVSGQAFKLRFGEKTGASCTSGVTWGDVDTASGVIRYYDGAGRNDGDNLTANAGDPDHLGHTKVAQDYEEANNFTNTVAAIPAGQDGLWDFSLINHSAVGGKRYCFKATKSDNSDLTAYNQYPEVIIDEELIFTLDATSKDFGTITPGATPTDRTSTLTTTTNAVSGYQVTLWATQLLTKAAFTIANWTGTNASPTTFTGAGSSAFGYNTNDSNLGGGAADRFTSAANLYAGFVLSGPGDPVADNTAGPIASEQFTITYRLRAGGDQASGTYTTTLIYICTATF